MSADRVKAVVELQSALRVAEHLAHLDNAEAWRYQMRCIARMAVMSEERVSKHGAIHNTMPAVGLVP